MSSRSGSFAHLHTHTEYSMLDGAARVAAAIGAAVADGQPAIGMTDHGNMYGALEFYKEANAQGIKPIIGSELYMAAESRHERPARRGRVDDTGGDTDGGNKLYYHLTALAETTQGYKNLIKLSSEAFLSGFYHKPRCLAGGTEIVTGDGCKAIEDVQIGDLVLTHRGRLRRVTQVMSRPFDGTIYGVRLNNRSGRVSWMTGEHPVLVRDRHGKRSWVEVQDLRAGRWKQSDEMRSWSSFACLPKLRPDVELESIRTADHVGGGMSYDGVDFVTPAAMMLGRSAQCRRWMVGEVDLDHAFGFLLGLFAAEGATYRGREVCFSLHEDEVDLIEAIRLGVKRLVGLDVRVAGRPDRPGHRGVDVTVSSPPLAHLLEALCGTGASHKHLPAFAFQAPDEFRQGLLDGVLGGDGADQPTCMIFTQTSRRLAWQVRALAAGLTDSFPCIAVQDDGNPEHAVEYRMVITRPSAVKGARMTLADDDYVYSPIADVLTKTYAGSVYNIEVEEDHSYVSDFAIHNCDWELLEQFREGLIATTGCLGGVVLQAMLAGNEELAVTRAARLQDIFGRDNLFVELQDHGIPEQRRTNPMLIRLAKRIQAPLLATNDLHYVHRSDAVSHDALLCVQTASLMSDPDRFKFHGDEHYLKSAHEMRSLFVDFPEACDNTLWVAERADVTIEFGNPQLPQFDLPVGFDTQGGYLRHLVYEGARERWGAALSDVHVQRIDYELGVIEDMGFSAYFLVVWDLIAYARRNAIRVGPGRGSAAGSAVSYCLKIVDLDPIRYDLLFERFLNPGRKQMPDIDMDFDSRYRADVIRYAADKYGFDHVAQIITFSTIKARAAVRDAARVLGLPYGVGDRVAKAMPPLVMGRDTPLWACFDEHDKYRDGYRAAGELRQMYETDPEVKQVVDVAKGLEGLRRGDSIHAAAVVITNEPLTEYLPIQRKPDAKTTIDQAPIVTQYEMGGVEELGLLKMDFLGLRNLDVIDMTVKLIKATSGENVDVDGVPLDDEATLSLLRRGDSIGVFQLEGGPMRALMRSLAPTSFDDVAALVALYRPGPMAANMHNDYADRKNGRKEITYEHPDMAKVLSDTWGLCIYQEQMMKLAQVFAGFTLEEADNLRKAAGKKKREVMAKEKEKFVRGAERIGYGTKLGTQLFEMIEPFADYAFNKSHSYGYGFVAYQTAWLKANHPVEYLACLMTSVKDDKDKTAVYLAECRSMGIDVLVPDVNLSVSDFTSAEGKIPFGLSAIRNVGEGLVGLVVSARADGGPFADFYDFAQRVDPQVLNKRTIESLVKAGAFDSLKHPRKGLLMVFDQIIDRTLAQRKEADQGIMSLFGDLDDGLGGGGFDDARVPIPDVEFDKKQRLAFEKEMLGLYISDHPLLGAEAALKRHTDCTIGELRDAVNPDGGGGAVGGGAVAGGNGFVEARWVGGVVTALNRKYTKKGELMATFVLEDLQRSIEVWVFPRTMMEVGHLLVDDAVVCIKGRMDTREDEPKLVCMDVKVPELILDGGPPLRVAVPAQTLTAQNVDRLKVLLSEHPGDSAVFLHVGTKVLRLPPEFSVDAMGGLVGELRVLFGPDCIV